MFSYIHESMTFLWRSDLYSVFEYEIAVCVMRFVLEIQVQKTASVSGFCTRKSEYRLYPPGVTNQHQGWLAL